MGELQRNLVHRKQNGKRVKCPPSLRSGDVILKSYYWKKYEVFRCLYNLSGNNLSLEIRGMTEAIMTCKKNELKKNLTRCFRAFCF